MAHEEHSGQPGFWRTPTGLTLIGFLAIAGFFLVTEHRAHLIPYAGYLPWLLLLACPLMHFFHGHGGHGDGGHDHGDQPRKGQ